MWTEHVDVTNLDCRLWPRGGAIATSLWGLDAASEDVLAPRATGSVTDNDLKYAAASGKAMIFSYIRHRYFLMSRGVEASVLTFHEVDDTASLRYVRSYVPRTFATEQDVYRYVDNQNTLPISGYKRFDIGSLHLTSQCPVIDKDVFRPLSSQDLKHRSEADADADADGDKDHDENTVQDEGATASRDGSSSSPMQYDVFKAVQINVADGFPGDRLALMTSWLKQKANNGVDIIGELCYPLPICLFHTHSYVFVFVSVSVMYCLVFVLSLVWCVGMCELNNWHRLDSTSLYHLQKNFPMFREYAASVGFIHSHVMHSKEHPYNVGIMASLPFTVMHEYRPPVFERGVLHVWFRTINVHVFVAHLDAHDSLLREAESSFLASVVSPLLQQGTFRDDWRLYIVYKCPCM